MKIYILKYSFTSKLHLRHIHYNPFHLKEKNLSDNIGSIEEGERVVVPNEKFLVNKDYVFPSSGHPPGYISIYMSMDEEYLNVFAEVEGDNTFDHGKDFFCVYIENSKKEHYQVRTVEKNQYGKCWFDYTDSSFSYQHMFYLIKIPLSDLMDVDNIKS